MAVNGKDAVLININSSLLFSLSSIILNYPPNQRTHFPAVTNRASLQSALDGRGRSTGGYLRATKDDQAPGVDDRSKDLRPTILTSQRAHQLPTYRDKESVLLRLTHRSPSSYTHTFISLQFRRQRRIIAAEILASSDTQREKHPACSTDSQGGLYASGDS